MSTRPKEKSSLQARIAISIALGWLAIGLYIAYGYGYGQRQQELPQPIIRVLVDADHLDVYQPRTYGEDKDGLAQRVVGAEKTALLELVFAGIESKAYEHPYMVTASNPHSSLLAQFGTKKVKLTFHFGQLERVHFEMEPGGLRGMVNTDERAKAALAQARTPN